MITIIICTHNRARKLQKCLESLAMQTANSNVFKVLVIDNNSSDNTSGIVELYRSRLSISLNKELNVGLSNARNTGVRITETPYVGFIDDDAEARTDWIDNAVRIIRYDRPAVFGGVVLPVYGDKKPGWFLDEYEIVYYSQKKKRLEEKEMLIGTNIFFKKGIFEEVGLFDNHLGMKGDEVRLGEETELQVKARLKGYSIWYDPQLVVYHHIAQDKMRLSYVLKRSFAYGKVSRKIFASENIGIGRDIYYGLRELIKFFIKIFIYPFRDKTKYPYWQNYLIYIIRPLVERVGKIYSYFKFT